MVRKKFSEVRAQISGQQLVTVALMPRIDKGYNLITLEWFMRTSISPAMFAISIGTTRYSHACLQAAKHFNLIFPSQNMQAETRYWGSMSGNTEDKLEKSGVNYFRGRLAGLPIIKDAACVFECEYVSQIKSGDHVIYIGEVKYSWQNTEVNPLNAQDLRQPSETSTS